MIERGDNRGDPHTPPAEWITPKEAARRLGCTERNVRLMVSGGRIVYRRPPYPGSWIQVAWPLASRRNANTGRLSEASEGPETTA